MPRWKTHTPNPMRAQAGWAGRLAMAILAAALPGAALAEVTVDPTRVVLEGRSRSAEISLTNTGDETETYRIAFKDVRMTETGEFETVENAPRPARDMIRFSPRQVTVAPGQSQTVRLALRKPPGLASGEYRSHLVFSAVPREGVPGLQAVYGVSIPIIVRQGDLRAEAALSELRLGGAIGGHPASLEATIERRGDRSVYGNLQVIHAPSRGEPRVIGTVNGVAVYTDTPRRRISIPLSEVPRDGAINLVYREPPKEGGDVLAQARLTR